jgi:sporulation protein YlmC with PRC-barrel domain
MLVMSDRAMQDKAVVTRDGHVIGSVHEVMVDTESWKVVRVGVKLRRSALEELGLKKPWIRRQEIEIPVNEIGGMQDELVLRHNAADLDFAGGKKA